MSTILFSEHLSQHKQNGGWWSKVSKTHFKPTELVTHTGDKNLETADKNSF